ncbi:MAG: DNA mismatch repair endonuclease MutL [Candidatus Omnitrophota bacterium]
MSQVNILPPEIVSKIAAGEVIERPASVVKELMENALDARAGSIELSLRGAGKSLISIKDTGTGIERGDIEKIFSRHATSKIQSAEHLWKIDSLGFRGEALYSIAAVSDVILRSKTREAESGWQVHLRGGVRLESKPASMTEGTELEIRELFFNTPARKKFLKSDTAELQQALNVFIPYAILHPERRFSLTHNDRSLLSLPAGKGYIPRIAQVLRLDGKYILEKEKEIPSAGLSLRLLLGDINIQRPRKDMQFIFVNRRPVTNYLIRYHLNQTYKCIFPPEVYPFFSVYLTVPCADIDVNVHPTKREVKLQNEKEVIAVLCAECEEALLSLGKLKQMKHTFQSIGGKGDLYEYPRSFHTEFSSDGQVVKEPPPGKYIFSAPDSKEEYSYYTAKTILANAPDSLKDKVSGARYIGTFLAKYLLFESGEALIVVDQHAAHERIIFEQLLRQMENNRVEIQQLLIPFVVNVSPQEKLIWEGLKEQLEKMGFATTAWDEEHIGLHAHPQLISNPETALRNLLAEEEGAPFNPEVLARRACRSSVMAGEKMSPEEAEYFMRGLLECKHPFTCPHGRPILLEIPEQDWAKQFLRK